MKKFIFIEPRSSGDNIFSLVLIPRLGTPGLGAILVQPDHGYEVRIYIENLVKIDMKDVFSADYVGISTITPTAVRAYELADEIRAKGKIVIMGGSHVSFMPEEALEHCDYVIRKEGEYSLPKLLHALENNEPLDSIPGLSYKKDGKVINNECGEYERNLNKFLSPDYSLIVGWKNKGKVVSIATSRGCPYNCEFCSVVPMFGREMRFYSIERVIEEIKTLAPTRRHIFFADDNFTANKERAKQLLRRILIEKIKFQWSAQVRTDAAKDEELISLMKQAGCYTVFIGFESVDPKTLKEYNKKQSLEDMEIAARIFKKYKINIHGMFVFGGNTTTEIIDSTEKFVKDNKITTVQFMVETPLPGTPTYDKRKQKGEIFSYDWRLYDAHHAVFQPEKMNPQELQTKVLEAMGRFYGWGFILKHIVKGMVTFSKGELLFALFGLYGKKATQKVLLETEQYFSKPA